MATTAQLRNAAHEAAARFEWATAADLFDLAADLYQVQPGRNTHGQLALLDIAKLRANAAAAREMTPA